MRPTTLFPAEHFISTLFHAPDPSEGIEEVSAPDYWRDVAGQLAPGQLIHLRWPDGSAFATLMVRAKSAGEILLGIVQHVSFSAEPMANTSGYDVKWRGPKAKFGIVRKADGMVLKDGFDVREQAERFLTGHLKALAA